MEPDTTLRPEDRTWGMLAHLLTLLGYVMILGHWLPPLVIYLAKKDESEFVADQARESLNFQITVLLLALVCLPFLCILIGIPMLIVLGLFQLVMVIVASVKASDGQRFRYPLTLRLVR
jgi:uncharacterized protein